MNLLFSPFHWEERLMSMSFPYLQTHTKQNRASAGPVCHVASQASTSQLCHSLYKISFAVSFFVPPLGIESIPEKKTRWNKLGRGWSLGWVKAWGSFQVCFREIGSETHLLCPPALPKWYSWKLWQMIVFLLRENQLDLQPMWKSPPPDVKGRNRESHTMFLPPPAPLKGDCSPLKRANYSENLITGSSSIQS